MEAQVFKDLSLWLWLVFVLFGGLANNVILVEVNSPAAFNCDIVKDLQKRSKSWQLLSKSSLV